MATPKDSLCSATIGAATSITVELQPGWAAGDLHVVFLSCDTFGHGWTNADYVFVSEDIGSPLPTGEIAYRILQAGDANPVFQFSQNRAQVAISVIIADGDFDATSPIDTVTADDAWNHGTSVSPLASAITLNVNNNETTALAVANIDAASANGRSPYTVETALWTKTPTGDCYTPGGFGSGVVVAHRTFTASGTTGDVEFSISAADEWKCAIVGINGAAGGGPSTHVGSGALQAQDAAVSGVGVVERLHTGTGALQAQDAAVSGLGTAQGIKEGTGALQAQDAAVQGVGVGVIEGTGALQAQDAAVIGLGAIVQVGTGALQAQDAAVSGIGELGTEKSGSGALQAQDAAVSGDGLRIPVGVGALQAQDAAVSGAGVTQELISGTGVLQAQPAAVVGSGEFTFDGAGVLQAQTAAVAGSGFLLGDLTLTEADLAAIQDAVWAKLVNEGLVAQINELWQRRGLDAANPQTYDKAGNQIRVGNITIDLTGDQSAVTQTRQP